MERVTIVKETPETVATQELENFLLQGHERFAVQGHEIIAQPHLQKDTLGEHRSITNDSDEVQAAEYKTCRAQDSDVKALLTLVEALLDEHTHISNDSEDVLQDKTEVSFLQNDFIEDELEKVTSLQMPKEVILEEREVPARLVGEKIIQQVQEQEEYVPREHELIEEDECLKGLLHKI